MRSFLVAALLASSWGCGADDPPGDGAGGAGGYSDSDCERPDRPAWLGWRDVVPDTDGDGVGSGPAERMCLAVGEIPHGWVAAGGPTDCAAGDASRWQVLRFAGRDADNDGRQVTADGEVCTGRDLPDGYFEAAPAGALDCDDGDLLVWQRASLFDDGDQDGVGAGEASWHCIGAEPPAGLSLVNGDCAPDSSAAWTLLTFEYRDADGDGANIAQEGEVCGGWSLPDGYTTWPGRGPPDCDDADPLRLRTWVVFADEDGDGIGAGQALALCAGDSTPEGYALVAGDCATADPARWRLLAYAFRDADLDLYTIAEAGTVCSGLLRPLDYRTDAGFGADCNDGDPQRFLARTGYPDGDGDGHGAGDAQTYCTAGSLPDGVVATGGDCAPDDATRHTALVSYTDVDGDGVGAGDPMTLCTGGTRPPGSVAEGGDCAPTDGAAWRLASYGFVDRDRDDRTIAEAGQVCTGSALPPPYETAASGNDCDDDDPSLLGWAVLYDDGDRDGVGAGPRSVSCTGATLPADQSIFGDDADDQDPVIQTDEEDEDELELILS